PTPPTPPPTTRPTTRGPPTHTATGPPRHPRPFSTAPHTRAPAASPYDTGSYSRPSSYDTGSHSRPTAEAYRPEPAPDPLTDPAVVRRPRHSAPPAAEPSAWSGETGGFDRTSFGDPAPYTGSADPSWGGGTGGRPSMAPRTGFEPAPPPPAPLYGGSAGTGAYDGAPYDSASFDTGSFTGGYGGGSAGTGAYDSGSLGAGPFGSSGYDQGLYGSRPAADPLEIGRAGGEGKSGRRGGRRSPRKKGAAEPQAS